MAKMKTNHKHYSAGAVIWIIIKYFSLVFFSFVALLPIVSCVITAFKTDAEYQSTNVMTLPESWLNFQNGRLSKLNPHHCNTVSNTNPLV